MKKLAILSSVALIGFGSLAAATDAEARTRRSTARAVAAGVVGGLAAGALIGAATNAYAAPGYTYGGYYPAYGTAYAPAATTYGYGTTYAPATTYRTTRVVSGYGYQPEVYEEYVPRRRYRTTRVVRSTTSYAPAAYSWGSPGVTVSYGAPAYGYRW